MLDRSRELKEYIEAPDDGLIICRCEEITKGEIRRAVHEGMWNVHEMRRFLRCGMGLCQGQTCARLVRSIIARELGMAPTELEEARGRAPMRPTEMFVLANEKGAGR
jgi:NAD(P)H-nitrite reductase large subunit